MRRAAALKLIGKRVALWTGMNGEYTGILRAVTDDRPWRGIVDIDGVTAAAAVERGRLVQRAGFRPGDWIEVGGSSIAETECAGSSYLTCLQADHRFASDWKDDERNRGRWCARMIQEVRAQQIEREKAGTLAVDRSESNARLRRAADGMAQQGDAA